MSSKNYNFDNFYLPLIILSNLFCLPVPSARSQNGISQLYLFYAIIIITGLLYTLIWSIGKMLEFSTKGPKLTLDILIICAMVLTNLISMLWCVLFRKKSMLIFVRKMKQVDQNLKVTEEMKPKRYLRFLLEMILLHIFAIFCGLYESYSIIIVFGFDRYYPHVIFYFNLYMITLTVLKIYQFSTAIKLRFILLNEKLTRIKTTTPITIVFAANNTMKEHKMVTAYRRDHLLLSECINLINDVFGIQILFITMLIVTFIVQAVNTAINYGNSSGGDETETYELILVCVWNTSLFITFAIMLATSCEQTIEEMSESQRICHKLLAQLPGRLSNAQEVLREELYIFANQIDHLNVQFTASGFFNVNHTLLLTIFGSIASYIIILIQFR